MIFPSSRRAAPRSPLRRSGRPSSSSRAVSISRPARRSRSSTSRSPPRFRTRPCRRLWSSPRASGSGWPRAPSTAFSSPSCACSRSSSRWRRCSSCRASPSLIMDKPGGQVSPALARPPARRRRSRTFCPSRCCSSSWSLALWAWLKRTNFGVAIYAVGGDVDSARAVGRADALRAVHGLRCRRRLLRSGRRLHQRADRVGRSADRQPHAAPDVRGRRRRRDEARRRAGRPARHGVRRLHPDDGGQHPPGPQCFGLLLDRSPRARSSFSRCSPPICGRVSARPPHPPCRPQAEGARARPPSVPTPADARFLSLPAFEKQTPKTPGRHARHSDAKRGSAALRAALPMSALSLVAMVTQVILGHALTNWTYYNSLIVLSSFLAVLALGQGTGDPNRRTRPLGALDHRAQRHPARRTGQGIRRRARLRPADRARSSALPSASSMAPESSFSASRRS